MTSHRQAEKINTIEATIKRLRISKSEADRYPDITRLFANLERLKQQAEHDANTSVLIRDCNQILKQYQKKFNKRPDLYARRYQGTMATAVIKTINRLELERNSLDIPVDQAKKDPDIIRLDCAIACLKSLGGYCSRAQLVYFTKKCEVILDKIKLRDSRFEQERRDAVDQVFKLESIANKLSKSKCARDRKTAQGLFYLTGELKRLDQLMCIDIQDDITTKAKKQRAFLKACKSAIIEAVTKYRIPGKLVKDARDFFSSPSDSKMAVLISLEAKIKRYKRSFQKLKLLGKSELAQLNDILMTLKLCIKLNHTYYDISELTKVARSIFAKCSAKKKKVKAQFAQEKKAIDFFIKAMRDKAGSLESRWFDAEKSKLAATELRNIANTLSKKANEHYSKKSLVKLKRTRGAFFESCIKSIDNAGKTSISEPRFGAKKILKWLEIFYRKVWLRNNNVTENPSSIVKTASLEMVEKTRDVFSNPSSLFGFARQRVAGHTNLRSVVAHSRAL